MEGKIITIRPSWHWLIFLFIWARLTDNIDWHWIWLILPSLIGIFLNILFKYNEKL